jgi:hypothetical protein
VKEQLAHLKSDSLKHARYAGQFIFLTEAYFSAEYINTLNKINTTSLALQPLRPHPLLVLVPRSGNASVSRKLSSARRSRTIARGFPTRILRRSRARRRNS